MSRAGSQELGEQEGGSVQVRAIKPLRECPPASWQGQWRHYGGSIASLPCSFPALTQLLLPCHTPCVWGRIDSACRAFSLCTGPETQCEAHATPVKVLLCLNVLTAMVKLGISLTFSEDKTGKHL